MELIERYIYEVTRHLSTSQRADVAKELRASIEDMAAGRAKNTKPTAADIEAVLKELGRPELLAVKYGQTKQYLIGPKWFELYKAVILRLLAVIPVVAIVISLVASLTSSPGPDTVDILAGALGAGIEAAMQVAFWVTLTFVIIEHSSLKPESLKAGEWEPTQLPALPKRQISYLESATSITTILAMAGLLLYAIIMPWAGESTPILNPSLWSGWVPALLTILGLGLILELFKLNIGNWTTPLAITNVVLAVLGSILVASLATTQVILNPAFVDMLQARAGEGSSVVANWMVTVVVCVVIIGSLWSAAESIYKTWRLRK